MPRFHGHLKASLQPLSGVIKVTLPIETPVIHVPLSGRVGGTLPHKSYSGLSWEDQTANRHLHGQSPRSGFAVIGPFEPMPSGSGVAPPRCHPPPDVGTLRHVNNSLPGPLSEGSVHGNGSRQPDNWLSALAEPFVTVLAHGNGVECSHTGCSRTHYSTRGDSGMTFSPEQDVHVAGVAGQQVPPGVQLRQWPQERRQARPEPADGDTATASGYTRATHWLHIGYTLVTHWVHTSGRGRTLVTQIGYTLVTHW